VFVSSVTVTVHRAYSAGGTWDGRSYGQTDRHRLRLTSPTSVAVA